MLKYSTSLLTLALLATACGPYSLEDEEWNEPKDDGEVSSTQQARVQAPAISASGATISWAGVPSADGYNVYLDDKYITTVEATSYVAQASGVYYVTSFDRDVNPTSYSGKSNTVDVTVGAATPEPMDGRPAAPQISANGAVVSWPAVASATGYNVYFNGDYATTVEGLEYTATQSGTYSVTSFNKNANPTTYSVQSNEVQVTLGGVVASGEYEEVFFDGFDGSTLSSNFSNPWTSVPGRAVSFSAQPCSQQGGHLELTIQKIGDEHVACYLASNRKDFGPGDDSTMKIEYRADVSQVKARGAWFAGWMYVTNGNGARDNDSTTGMETDVFEYMPTYDSAYNVAAHDGASTEEWITANSTFGVDLRTPGFHTYGVEWNKHCQVFTFDGQKVFTSRSPLSTAKVHSIMLTMEAETGLQWGFWDVGDFTENLKTAPAVGKMDWVKVSQKDGADASLCD